MTEFETRLKSLREQHEELLSRKNIELEGNGVYCRYKYPILTGDHAPLEWRYDLDEQTNPYLMERFGIHAAFNSGAIKW
ncbi:MAG: glycosidase, partial [Bacteroidales bacterium]|nr:glycosidase [Bacteroidales bacterium]